MKLKIAKHRLGGYCVSIDGKRLASIFRLKKDAESHMINLKRVSDAIEQKFKA